MENKIEVPDENDSFKAKNLSKFSMIFASIWIVVMTILKAMKIIEIEMEDVILSGLAVVGVWSPTYLSIWLDKIKEIRFGK